MEFWHKTFWAILVSLVVIGWIGLACGWGQ